MLIELAGLLSAATLLLALVALEFRRAGADTVPPARRRIIFGTISHRIVAVMWMLYLFLFFPRVLGLLS